MSGAGTLHYDCPGAGNWGMARTGSLVPESVELFVCPAACGRHGALSAYKEGWKERLFYLYLEPHELVDGYADLIPDAVEEILENLALRPRAFYIFLTCIDDLIGTDREALMAELEERFPDIRFCHGHMNPIASASKTPPMVGIQNNLYGFLDPAPAHDGGINLIGPAEADVQAGELPKVLAALGATCLRHIGSCGSFDEFQSMAKSRGNLVTMPTAVPAAKEMERRLGIPWVYVPVSYDPARIREDYGRIAKALFPEKTLSLTFEREAELVAEETRKTREMLGNLPIILDSTAVLQPYHLALYLLEQGFHVVRVEEMDYGDMERQEKERLLRDWPEVEIFYPERPGTVHLDRGWPESLSVGMVAGYLAGSVHVADLFSDFGMFGFDGAAKLMRRLREAAAGRADVRAMIEAYGLVI